MVVKRLNRSRKNKVLAGVCGGLGDYFKIDPTIVRVGFIIAAIFGGSGILAYIICWVIIPQKGAKKSLFEEWTTEGGKPEKFSKEAKKSPQLILGLFLLFIGVLFLFNNLGIGLTWPYTWPFIIIFIGLIIVIGGRKK